MDYNDELTALLGRCALRDPSALKQLFDRTSGYLNAVAFRILHSDDLSRDVLQEAFVQIWQNAASYRPDRASPLTWLTSIVRYRALDQLARERKHASGRERGPDNEGDGLDGLPGQDSPESGVAQWQMRTHLKECIARLSERMREAITLAYLEGYSREELAERFASNTNTVKSWLHRGAERLRQCLETKI